jgi:hypothetical protein
VPYINPREELIDDYVYCVWCLFGVLICGVIALNTSVLTVGFVYGRYTIPHDEGIFQKIGE